MFVKLDAPDGVSGESENFLRYKDLVRDLAAQSLPEFLFLVSEDEETFFKKKNFLSANLPIIKHSFIEEPDNYSFTISLLCKYRFNAGSFFYDMISRWLVPNKPLNVQTFFASDFQLMEFGEEVFTVAELVVRLDSAAEQEEVRRNIKSLESELRLGIISVYHANRIIEFKGLSCDRKTAMIQDKIGSLIQSRPQDFGRSIFAQMQHFLVTCRDDFKTTHDHHHISRIISNLHSIRKLLKLKIDSAPRQRHMIVKFLKTQLTLPHGGKAVLGVIVGLNFLKEHEIFEKDHLIKGINNFIPNVQIVENSFFVDRHDRNTIQTVYLEVEKKDNTDFSFDEIQKLRVDLPTYLKGHIEHLMHPVFMPRNEEEVVRNIMTLARQLKYVHDVPQVIVTFEKQTAADLTFTVVLLRVLKDGSPSVEQLFSESLTFLKFLPDRVKKVGALRKKYSKEANVFRAQMPIRDYIRSDHSIDLNKARQDVIFELTTIFKDVRDYNGGLMLKQSEAYYALKKELGPVAAQNEILLDKFFYSLQPVEMTMVASLHAIRAFFIMLQSVVKRDAQHDRKQNGFIFKHDVKGLYCIFSGISDSLRKKVERAATDLNLAPSCYLWFALNIQESNYLGYVIFSREPAAQQKYLKVLRAAAEADPRLDF